MMVVPFCDVQTGVQIDHQGKKTYTEGTPDGRTTIGWWSLGGVGLAAWHP